eukprot:gene15954-10830_t
MVDRSMLTGPDPQVQEVKKAMKAVEKELQAERDARQRDSQDAASRCDDLRRRMRDEVVKRDLQLLFQLERAGSPVAPYCVLLDLDGT